MKKILKNMMFAAIMSVAVSCSLKEEPTSFVNKHNWSYNGCNDSSSLYAGIMSVIVFIISWI